MLEVYAAGSLRSALTEVAHAFERQEAVRVKMTFGASGLLKERIMAGETPQVFASANMAHPGALAAAGKASEVAAFAGNTMCVLAAPSFSLQGKTLALRLLDDEVRVGISTPGSDPSGDYAFDVFERIEASSAAGAGSARLLKRKARQLTGAADSPRPSGNGSIYGELVAGGQADAFLTYRTNAVLACGEHPGLKVVPVPQAINVCARYGLALLVPETDAARRYVRYLVGSEGQAILSSYGFSAPCANSADSRR